MCQKGHVLPINLLRDQDGRLKTVQEVLGTSLAAKDKPSQLSLRAGIVAIKNKPT